MIHKQRAFIRNPKQLKYMITIYNISKPSYPTSNRHTKTKICMNIMYIYEQLDQNIEQPNGIDVNDSMPKRVDSRSRVGGEG